jgi:nitroreductase
MNEVLKTIAARRSVRQFRREQIKDSELMSIIEAGLQAPTAHNDQSCYFTIIQNKALIDEINRGSKIEMSMSDIDWVVKAGKNEKLHIFYNAPTVIIVSGRKDAVSPFADVCIAIENMLIAAESLNIGSCWIGFAKYFFNDIENLSKVPIPEGYEPCYGVSLGYKPENLKLERPERKYKEYYTIIK